MVLAPVYFISHGGPPTQFNSSTGAFKAWQTVGQHIQQAIQEGRIDSKKGLIGVSAHWESSDESGKTIQVNTDTTNPLIYDFYGFPRHFYAQQFMSSSNFDQVNAVTQVLQADGWKVEKGKRGLDHGLWVPLKIAFNQPSYSTTSPTPPTAEAVAGTPPILQISLPGDSNPETALALGSSLSKLRQEGYAIVATGQAVHNLADLRTSRVMGGSGSTPYSLPFLTAFLEAATSPLATLADATTALYAHRNYKQAHPTIEHLLPISVAAGAAAGHPRKDNSTGPEADKRGSVIYSEDDGSLGWAMVEWE